VAFAVAVVGAAASVETTLQDADVPAANPDAAVAPLHSTAEALHTGFDPFVRYSTDAAAAAPEPQHEHAPAAEPQHEHAPAAKPQHEHAPPPADGGAAPGAVIYSCPMHPQIRGSAPAKCPICGMKLVPEQGGSTEEKRRE
jgi:hypothetical protein